MSNSTLQRPKQQNRQNRRRRTATASRTGKPVALNKRGGQTARFEGLRDGKPLIFGWGKHLTRSQKLRYQKLMVYSFVGLVVLAIIGTLAFGWLNENVIIPNKTIVTVNGVNISQDSYRKEMAYVAQTVWNRLQKEITEYNAIQAQVQQGNPQAVNENGILTPQIQSDESAFSQTQLSQTAIGNLIDDQLIMAGAHKFESERHLSSSVFEPSDQAVAKALAAFKAAFPKNESYSSFLSGDNITEGDLRNSIRMDLRSQMMQKYLASQLVSPTRQVHLRFIETNTMAQAQQVNAQLKAKKYSDAAWKTLAAKDSLDPNTKQVGGDAGWLAPGQGDAAVELWAFASGRKVGDVTVLRDSNGTFDVEQILGFDPHRKVDASTLSADQNNALTHWLNGQKTPGINSISTPDSGMLSDSRNIPSVPNLNATLPQVGGTPGAVPSL